MTYSIEALSQAGDLQKKMENIWFRQALGTRLRSLRIERQIEQAKLADDAGMTASNLCKIEMGQRYMTLYNIAALCLAMGISPDELMPKKEEPEHAAAM
jgi:transcriptional regulator with XRE-family HTH domain